MLSSKTLTAERYFWDLGRAIRTKWRDAHCDEAAFAEIAARILQERPPSKSISLFAAIEFAFFAESFPYQVDLEATFGQPPVTVYYADDFRIELLFWLEGLPGVHQHAFSGAFHVLHGSSLHSGWKFDCTDRVNDKLLIGKLSCVNVELLRTGDTRLIRAGCDFVHATYHLDRPTVSLVIRTNKEIARQPQYLYYPPTIAIAPNMKAPVIQRRSQLLRMLAALNESTYLPHLVLQYLETADIMEIFYGLEEIYPLLRATDHREALYKLIRQKKSWVISGSGNLASE